MPSPAAKPWASVVEQAERQLGLLRRGDLIALGLHGRRIRRLVESERLHQLHPGVYALGHRSLPRNAQWLAAVWWAGAGAALSHASAAAFYGWVAEDSDAWPVIHVSVVGEAVRSKPGVGVHRTRHLDHHDVVAYGPLRVTDRVRTLVDLADHLSYEELRRVADQLPSLPTKRLEQTAARLPGRIGAGRTQRLIRSRDADTRSALERRYVRYCEHHGVPHPERRNVRVHGVRVDCWYRGARLVVELDSRAHHTSSAEMEADRLRDRALKRQGIDTLRLVWRDLDPADPLAAEDILQWLGVGSRRPQERSPAAKPPSVPSRKFADGFRTPAIDDALRKP